MVHGFIFRLYVQIHLLMSLQLALGNITPTPVDAVEILPDGEAMSMEDLFTLVRSAVTKNDQLERQFELFKSEMETKISTFERRLKACTKQKLERNSVEKQPPPPSPPPLHFHTVHGENVELSVNNTVATRIKDYGKAYVFSDRPIRIDENIQIRVVETTDDYVGDLVVGFTTKDPTDTTLANVLHLRHAQFVQKVGLNGIVELDNNPLHDIQANSVLTLSVNEEGQVNCTVDGESKGIILRDIDTTTPIWFLVDVYGKTKKVEFVHEPCELWNELTDGGSGSAGGVQVTPVQYNSRVIHDTNAQRISQLGGDGQTPFRLHGGYWVQSTPSTVQPNEQSTVSSTKNIAPTPFWFPMG